MLFVTITFTRGAWLVAGIAAGAPTFCCLRKEACFITIDMADLSLHDVCNIVLINMYKNLHAACS